MKKLNPLAAINFILIFTAVLILISSWLGLVWRNSFFILIVSLIISFFLYRRYRLDLHIPKKIYLLTLLVFVMSAYPLLFIHPYFNSSADPAPTIGSLVIEDKIPETYAPYSDLPYNYQIGFPLFAKIFIDFQFLPPYLITWLVAAIFSAIQLILVYVFAYRFLGSEKVGEWASVFFVGSKILFQNMYVGEYSWILATTFLLASLIMFISRNKLAYLFIPVVFIVNPAPAFNIVLFFVIYLFFFRNQIKNIFLLIPALILAIPSFLITYISVAGKNFSTNVVFGNLPSILVSIPLWFGLVPFVFVFISLVMVFWKKINITKKEWFLFTAFLVAVILHVVFNFGVSDLMASGRILEFGFIAGIVFSGSVISKSGLKFTDTTWLKIVVIVLCIVVFLSSSQLNHLRAGSKITQDEAEFSLIFKEFDVNLEKTLFLSSGGSKMAEYSNKIPYNAKRDHFISSSKYLAVEGPGLDDLNEREKKWNEIVEKKCASCVYNLDAKYVVINKNFIDMRLNEEPVLSYKYFDLYELFIK